MDISELKSHLAFAVNLAEEAGGITLSYFRKGVTFDLKEDMTPVTAADRESEIFIRSGISKAFPHHGILGEEFGQDNPKAETTWMIDPIDGTKSFILGIPLYSVLIALVHKGEPVLGVIHNPPMGETVSAARGCGCFCNGSPCRVTGTEKLSEASVQVTDYAILSRLYPDFTTQLISSAGSCRTWGDAYGYILVATGRADVMIDPIMNRWDIAPLKVITEEAGGQFTDIAGGTRSLGSSSIASNGLLHREILNLHGVKEDL